MKFSILLTGLGLSALTTALAQSGETVRVKSGTSLAAADKYLYAQFAPGIVHYRNGQAPTARLNYNLLLQEMQFLSPRGDTLTLDQELTIEHIDLNGATFRYDPKQKYIQLVSAHGPVQLGLVPLLQVIGVEKEGGYEKSSGASSIKTYRSYSNGNSSISQLDMKGDVVYAHRGNYMVVGPNDLVLPASRKNILKMFPRQKKEIEAYLKENPVQFEEVTDLQRLLDFCQQVLQK